MQIKFFGGPWDGQYRAVNESPQDSIVVRMLHKPACGYWRKDGKFPSIIPMSDGAYRLKCLYGSDTTFFLYTWTGTRENYLDPSGDDVIRMLIEGYQPSLNLE